jgi:hypothetical protein
MDDIVVEYITELVSIILMYLIVQRVPWSHWPLSLRKYFFFVKVHKAQDIGSQRGKLSVEDFLYLIRKVLFC